MFWSWEGMGVVTDIISWASNYSKQNEYLETLIRSVLRTDEHGELSSNNGVLPFTIVF